jgi:hypothetical protein
MEKVSQILLTTRFHKENFHNDPNMQKDPTGCPLQGQPMKYLDMT